MDTPSEDTMVRQIEKNLSDQMNENLFIAGRSIEDDKQGTVRRFSGNSLISDTSLQVQQRDYPLVSHDYINTSPSISRAEYIRQAREACLRQLSSVQLYSRPYDVNYMESDHLVEDTLAQKKAKVMKLFPEDKEPDIQPIEEEIAHVSLKYQSLIIRSVGAVVLFISAFLVDKFKIDIGSFSHSLIKEYVTGNDALKQLENIIVTWLK